MLPPAPPPIVEQHRVPGVNLARIRFSTVATTAPGGRGVVARVPNVAPLSGEQNQLAVDDQRVADGLLYVRVMLPQRPNGIRGWIRADDTQLARTDYRVDVSLRRRALVVRHAGRVVRRVRVVVGKPGSPTPTGRFAVADVVRQVPATNFLGAWVLPLTAFSGTYRQFQGGPGQVALHGRGGASLRDPVGSAASHGCVRLRNEDVTWLAGHLPPGTRVTISA
jgi:lipoprotein-anchoring transpeptidase ErfK/SrfK